MPKRSGLQLEVLTLYRQCLRAAARKPEGSRPNFKAFIRREFKQHAEIDRKAYGSIEFYLRRGRRQLETYESPGITNIS